ncbi:MAG: hypothetical protein QXS57_01855 [Candidatus Caldarchaeum sp.]
MSDQQPAGDKRLKSIEEEIKRIREPLERTLLDIREMLNSAENPFNVLAQAVRSAETHVEQIKPERSAGRPADGEQYSLPQQEVVVQGGERASFRDDYSDSLSYFIQVLTAVDLMTVVVGKDYLLRLINMLAWKKLISKDLVEVVKEALEFLSSIESSPRMNPVHEAQPSITDVLIVLYLIYLLSKNDEAPLTFLLLSSSSSLKMLSKNWGGRQ